MRLFTFYAVPSKGRTERYNSRLKIRAFEIGRDLQLCLLSLNMAIGFRGMRFGSAYDFVSRLVDIYNVILVVVDGNVCAAVGVIDFGHLGAVVIHRKELLDALLAHG